MVPFAPDTRSIRRAAEEDAGIGIYGHARSVGEWDQGRQQRGMGHPQAESEEGKDE